MPTSMGKLGSYRWMVVGVSTAVNALAWGARSTFALFYVAILEEFAWGRGPTALGYSLSWLCFVVFAPAAGWLYDRWGVRTVVTIGGLALGVALGLTGQVTSLTQYYLCFGVLGAAGTACILIPSTAIVTRWFTRSRGTAMGVLSAGNAAGAVAFYPVNAWLIATLVPDAMSPPLGAAVWADTRVEMPGGTGGGVRRYRNAFTGATLDVTDGTITAAEVFDRFPVALLTT